jgi:hypothetical protein
LAGALAGVPPDRKGWKHEFLSAQGELLYRLGRFREAIDRIEEGIAAGDGDVRFEETAFLAMAYHESGNAGKARAILFEQQLVASEFAPEEYWKVRARVLLRREVERMILDRPFPADAFAR